MSVEWKTVSRKKQGMPVQTERPLDPPPGRKRKYNGPVKGSEEAKARMEKVRAAQWAKNGLMQSSQSINEHGS